MSGEGGRHICRPYISLKLTGVSLLYSSLRLCAFAFLGGWAGIQNSEFGIPNSEFSPARQRGGGVMPKDNRTKLRVSS